MGNTYLNKIFYCFFFLGLITTSISYGQADPLPTIVPNTNRGLPVLYSIADNRSELYFVAPDPTASPLPSPTFINVTLGGSPVTFSGEGGGYRSTDRLIYVFQGGEPTAYSDLYSIDPSTGVATLVKTNIVAGHVEGAEFYINNTTGEEVLVVVHENGTSGGSHKVTAINPNAQGSNPAWSDYSGYPKTLTGARTTADGISWDPIGANFYIQNDDTVDYYLLDIATAVTTYSFTSSLAVDGEGITYASDGNNYIEDEGQAGQGRRIFSVDVSTGALTPVAELGSTGDVESIMGNLGVRDDAGDAPSSYGYASHMLPILVGTPVSVYLGSVPPDSEDPFVNFSIGTSDDNTGDDEDGVTSGGLDLSGQLLTLGQTKTIDIVANGSGVLNAWIDFNRDGDFDDITEQIATDVVPSGGSITLNVPVALTATAGTSYARFRYSSETGLVAGNYEASDGEVEDYQIIIYDNVTCSPGSTLVETTTISHIYATSVIVDNSVSNQNNALGSDDTTTASFNNNSDQLVLEMGQIINSGDSVTVNGENGDDFDIWVSSSATGPWIQVGTNAQLDFTFSSPSNWLYIRLERGDSSGTENLSYIDASSSTTISSCELDNDNDGIPDKTDIDDDNDGITDTQELCNTDPVTSGVTNSTIAVSILTDNYPGETTWTLDAPSGQIASGGPYASANTNYNVSVPTTETGVFTFTILDSYGDGICCSYGNGAYDVVLNGTTSVASGGNFGSSEATDFTINVGAVSSFSCLTSDPNGDDDTDGTLNYADTDYATANGSTLNSNGVVSILDTDGDGVINSLDLDSDNDGIYDAVEAGHDQSHTNGLVNGGYGVNGLANVVETIAESGILNYTITDSDGTGSNDYLDLDSDDDSCNDVVEAGFTDDNSNGLLGPLPLVVDGNGLVTSGSDGYTSPADADSNTIFDFQEVGIAPSISTQPLDATACPGCNTTFSVVVTNTDTYQWQRFNGSIWVNLADTGIYSGTTTSTLTLTNGTTAENGNQYRVIISNSSYICASVTSNVATLTIMVNTVITNRRITIRVNKN